MKINQLNHQASGSDQTSKAPFIAHGSAGNRDFFPHQIISKVIHPFHRQMMERFCEDEDLKEIMDDAKGG